MQNIGHLLGVCIWNSFVSVCLYFVISLKISVLKLAVSVWGAVGETRSWWFLVGKVLFYLKDFVMGFFVVLVNEVSVG